MLNKKKSKKKKKREKERKMELENIKPRITDAITGAERNTKL